MRRWIVSVLVDSLGYMERRVELGSWYAELYGDPYRDRDEIGTYRERGHSGIADCLSSRLRTGLIS